jgi:hypothetical protein
MPTVAERLLKVGIKAAVPIVGDLVAAALEQTSGYLLDQQAERKANDLHARLLKALNARFQQAEASGEIRRGQLEYLLPTLEEILARHPLRHDEWASFNFDIDAAAHRTLSAASALTVGLSEEDLTVLRLALASFYRALHQDQAIVLQCELEFKRAVLDRIDRLPERIARATDQREIAPLARWRYRSEIDDLIKWLATAFVGREEEVRRLMSFASEPGSGYCLLEAEGGMGKSALLAQLILRLEKGEWAGPRPTLITFFVRDPGWRRPDEYLASVNSQLLGILGRHGGTPSDLLSLRAQFSELWTDAAAAASAERPLLLVVDGLDEMAGGETTIAHLLPSVTTEHARVIVSSRPRPSPCDFVTERHPLRTALLVRLSALNESAVTTLLQGMGVPAGLAYQITPRVYSLTRGEPLFARALAEEVAARGEGALEALEREPPATAREYFLRQLKAIDRAAEDDSSWRLCEVLAAAKGALSIDEVAAVLGVSRRAVRQALKPIERFVIGEDRIQLFHHLLYESLQEELGNQDLARITASIVSWCSKQQDTGWKDGASYYALAHYAEHLADAGNHSRLQSLVDGKWLHEHQRVFGVPRFFIRDAELAISSATKQQPADVFNELRGALSVATARSMAISVPTTVIEVLAAGKRKEEAEAYAQLADPCNRAQAFAALAVGLHRAGDGERAQVALDAAIGSLRTNWFIPSPEGYMEYLSDKSMEFFVNAAALVLGVEGLERLSAAVQRLTGKILADSPKSVRLGLLLAERAVSLGDLRWPSKILEDAARQVCIAIDNYESINALASTRQLELAVIDKCQILVPLITLAERRNDLSMLNSIEVLLMRFPKWTELALPAAAMAKGFASVGDHQRAALWTARSIQLFFRSEPFEYEWREMIELLSEAATGPSRVGVLHAIVETVPKMEVSKLKNTIADAVRAASLAESQNPTDEFAQYARTQRDVADRSREADRSPAIVASLAGDLVKARDLIGGLDSAGAQNRARQEAVIELIKISRFNDALALAQEITIYDERVDASGAIAAGALAAGQLGFALKTADRVIEMCRNLGDLDASAYFFSKIAVALAKIGRPNDTRAHALRSEALLAQKLSWTPLGRQWSLIDKSRTAAALAFIIIAEFEVAQSSIDKMMHSERVDAQRELALALRARGLHERVRAIIKQLRKQHEWELRSDGYRFAVAAELSCLEGDFEQARVDLSEAERSLFVGSGFPSVRGNIEIILKMVEAYKYLRDTQSVARLRNELLCHEKEIEKNITSSLFAAATLQAEGNSEAALLVARRALETCVAGASSDDWSYHVPELARLLGAEALPLLDRLRRLLKEGGLISDGASTLMHLSRSFEVAGDTGRAVDTFREAALTARSEGLGATLTIIAEGADILGQSDGGETLIRISEAYDNVKSWWARTENYADTMKDPPAP